MAEQAEAEYEQDFFMWTQQQARVLREATRAGINLPLDWENVAEEIESLGRSGRNEIESRIETIIEHLLKLQSSPATRPRHGWQATILRERARLTKRLAQNRSLRHEVPRMIAEEMAIARSVVARELALRGEALSGLPDYTEEQVLGDWLPDDR